MTAFTVYMMTGNTLTPDVAFVSLSLLGTLSRVFSSLPLAVSYVIQVQYRIDYPSGHDVIIASLLGQNDVAMSFWRNDDFIITLCARWLWHHDMETFSALLVLWHKAGDAEIWCSICCQPEQAIEQTFDLPLIWGVHVTSLSFMHTACASLCFMRLYSIKSFRTIDHKCMANVSKYYVTI